MSTALDQADGSCDASRQAAVWLGDRADADEFNRGSTLEDDDVATLNTIRGTYLAGTDTRRVRRALAALFGGAGGVATARGLCRPSAFGMYVRRDGDARYAPRWTRACGSVRFRSTSAA